MPITYGVNIDGNSVYTHRASKMRKILNNNIHIKYVYLYYVDGVVKKSRAAFFEMSK